MKEIVYIPIGIIHSPYNENDDAPVQPVYANDTLATLEIFDQYEKGLKDLDGFDHLVLLFHLNRISGYSLQVVPHFDSNRRGVFATRSPSHPNSIGLSIVKLVNVKNNIITVKGIDALDKTPLLDIKPYIQHLDYREKVEQGWWDKIKRKIYE